MSHHSYPPKMCITGNSVVQSSWQNETHHMRRLSSDTKSTTLVPCVRELGLGHMVNISEVLINIVSGEQPKVLIGCDPSLCSRAGQKVQGQVYTFAAGVTWVLRTR